MPAVETLGSATAICSDKTGTLTQNQMTAVRVATLGREIRVDGHGYNPYGDFHAMRDGHEEEIEQPTNIAVLDRLVKTGALCNDAKLVKSEESEEGWVIVGDPTEGSLVVLSAKAGLWADELNETYPRVAEVPFDSDRKRMTTFHNVDGQTLAYTKGAPDLLVALCDRVMVDGEIVPMTDERREAILEANANMASDALRVLGMAYREWDQVPEEMDIDVIEKGMIFLGLVGMIDPPRPEVRDAVAVAKRAGLRTFMVTGDYRLTAAAIANQLDIMDGGDNAVTGSELEEMTDVQLDSIVEHTPVFARVSPQHKVRIVSALRRLDHVVAMTGDGVNDAPALKRADIGVAMGITGTDVSKETADMVLTDDNYASIVSAVEQGRIIYSNIRKFVYYLISCNMGEIAILFISMLAGLPLPLTALQLLVLNLVTDGAPALALGMETGEPGIMGRKPRPVNEPIINGPMIWGTAIQTVAIAGATLGAFLLGLWQYGSEGQGLIIAETMAFATLSLSELLRAYTARSERYPLLKMGVFSNPYMQWAVLFSTLVVLAILYIPGLNDIFGVEPLGLTQWLEILPLMFLPAIVAEVQKMVLYNQEQSEE
jgi:Ca2+-transporting ATPase